MIERLNSGQTDNLDSTQVRAMEFAHVVGQLTAIKVMDTDFAPFEEPSHWALNRFMSFEAESNVLYLPKQVINASQKLEPGDLKYTGLRTTSSKKSQHSLFFADLSGRDFSLRLAVKPHEDGDGWRPAVHEQIMTKAFIDIGLRALQPMGVVLFEGDEQVERKSYSLTALHEGLTTFDSMEWRGYYSQRAKHPGMTRLWRQAATVTADIHASGRIAHGDLWARNLATSPVSPVMSIDQELASISENPPRDAEIRYGYSFADLTAVMRSIVLPKYFSGLPREVGLNMVDDNARIEWFKVFEEVFFKYYRGNRKRLKDNEPSSASRRDIDDELGQLTVDLKKGAENLQERYLNSQ